MAEKKQDTFTMNVYVAKKTSATSGKKFNTFFTRTKDSEKTTQVKFTTDCEPLRVSAVIRLKNGQANLGTDKAGYKCWWINGYEFVSVIEKKSTDLEQYLDKE